MFGLRGSWVAHAVLALGISTSCGPQPAVPAPPERADAGPVAKESGVTAPAPASADDAFRTLAKRFLAEYLRREPVRSTELGDHSNDARWPDVSEAGDTDTLTFIKRIEDQLAALDRTKLDRENRVDHAILATQLQAWSLSLRELRPRERDPLSYTGLFGDAIDPLVTRSFAPHEVRMETLRARLEALPPLVEVAKKRLKTPPRIHTETAIQQNRGLVQLCESGLAEHAAKLGADKRAGLEAAAKRAAAALRDFQTFLEKDLLPRSTGSFRLGRPLFEKKLRMVLEDDVEIDAVARQARELLAKTQEEMVATATELWPSLSKEPMPPSASPAERRALVRKVLDVLAKDRSDDASIVKDAQKTLDDATRFVRDRDLVRMPGEPVKIVEMPEYRRGVAIAYCDSSGPLEEKQETFYAISPTPKDWPKKRVESFYREYNKSMLHDLTVHEAMPGHYLQLMHANAFESPVRAVFASGPFIEGWAVYAEWVMAKHGFGGPKVRMMRQKMVLRLSTNAVLDHGVHAGELDEKEALRLMMEEAFQEEGEAVGKWRRARLSSAQLTTYFYGFTRMMALRAEAEKKPGFSERKYHDELLRHGSPGMKHARELLLDTPP